MFQPGIVILQPMSIGKGSKMEPHAMPAYSMTFESRIPFFMLEMPSESWKPCIFLTYGMYLMEFELVFPFISNEDNQKSKQQIKIQNIPSQNKPICCTRFPLYIVKRHSSDKCTKTRILSSSGRFSSIKTLFWPFKVEFTISELTLNLLLEPDQIVTAFKNIAHNLTTWDFPACQLAQLSVQYFLTN